MTTLDLKMTACITTKTVIDQIYGTWFKLIKIVCQNDLVHSTKLNYYSVNKMHMIVPACLYNMLVNLRYHLGEM